MEWPVVAVLGAGNVGHAMAGHLALKGYDVRLFNRWEHELTAVREAGGIYLQQTVEGFGRPSLVTTSIEEAIRGADVILITVPAFGHRYMSESIALFVSSGQVVVFQPGTFGSALELTAILRAHGKVGIVAAETESSLYSCRLVGPARVNVRAVKKAVELAALPASETGRVLAMLNKPFDGGYVPAENVLQVGLGNGNPVYHCGPSLVNFGRIERAEDWPFFEFVTESVTRLIDSVDRERLALVHALGLKTMSFWEFLESAYGASDADYVLRVHRAYGRGRPSRAPKSPEDRYLTEDIPFGLVPWSSLAKQLQVPTPTIDALIQVASVLYGRDFFKEGRTAESLGLAGLTATEIKARVTDGFAAETKSIEASA